MCIIYQKEESNCCVADLKVDGLFINDNLHIRSLLLELIDSGILGCRGSVDRNALELGERVDCIPKAVNVTCAINRKCHIVQLWKLFQRVDRIGRGCIPAFEL